METKLNRIAAFIDSLPEESRLGNVQSTLLSTKIDWVGGAQINKDDCSNSFTNCGSCYNATPVECSGATNGGICRNGVGMCVGGINDGMCAGVPIVVGPQLPPNSGNCAC